ncbi:hypothetical protein CDD81_1300 [Ophiocordyceps australis]|uniref:26S proteasome non-ATPase regulatory subunit 3 N-terminal TPR repeats domain-containing protein n=1 Tax=Ophiocordyceps australis TaxID=1399860 RepID=A0A2C5Y0M1_9HYPO|nr:hypothetical protein CDD81_1300 [Ophiocordyceps australis]
MPGKTPKGNSNGKEPLENGLKSTRDVDKDKDKEAKSKGSKTTAAMDVDEEMTVVVPPSKASKQPKQSRDADGDISMNDGDEANDGQAGIDPTTQTVADIKSNFALLDRAVALFDARFSLRALRSISLIRKRLTPEILGQVIAATFPATGPSANIAHGLLAAIGHDGVSLGRPTSADMDIDGEGKQSKNGKKDQKEIIPEIDVYLGILVQVYLYDTRKYQNGADFSKLLSERVQTLNRRTLDSLSAKVYFYYSLFCEHLDPLPPCLESPIVAIRPTLLAALRTAVLRKDIDTQASVIVLLLRNYLLTSHIGQADLLVSHTQFPENAVNNQVARFLYYLGRIRAIQLRYTEAHEHLTAATRKAPSSGCAVGFSQTATKLLLVVELLMGDIPDRATFRQPSMEDALHPYFLLVQAVRIGNLEDFETVIADHADIFRRDGTYTLILRLRQNVIKTGIRMMEREREMAKEIQDGDLDEDDLNGDFEGM